MRHKILVLDDDATILDALEKVFKEEKFQCLCSTSPIQVLKDFKNGLEVDLIIVDIWIPEMDGILFVKKFREFNKTTPILSISGHANLNSNFEIAKMGVNDFLEKPFDKNTLVIRVKKLLGIKEVAVSEVELDTSSISHLIKISNQKQRTIKKNVALTGAGIRSGYRTGIILSPLPVNSGIVFEDVVSAKRLKVNLLHVDNSKNYTSLVSQDFSIELIEHLMATLSSYSIDNVLIKVNKEIPIMDGSAKDFCQLLESAGFVEQDELRKEIVIDKIYTLIDEKNPSTIMTLEPYDGLHLTYNYVSKELTTSFSVDLTPNPAQTFKNEIAPARTFGEITNYDPELNQGVNMTNVVILKNGEVLNTELRFENEMVRHKVLDICGDISLLGFPIRGKLIATKTGHRHTTMLLKKILSG